VIYSLGRYIVERGKPDTDEVGKMRCKSVFLRIILTSM
jgi:hypothetical protein